jgi:uncharacterized lipoprotein YddW (UPF0748 family)
MMPRRALTTRYDVETDQVMFSDLLWDEVTAGYDSSSMTIARSNQPDQPTKYNPQGDGNWRTWEQLSETERDAYRYRARKRPCC